jgi:hypothetical protein
MTEEEYKKLKLMMVARRKAEFQAAKRIRKQQERIQKNV